MAAAFAAEGSGTRTVEIAAGTGVRSDWPDPRRRR